LGPDGLERLDIVLSGLKEAERRLERNSVFDKSLLSCKSREKSRLATREKRKRLHP